MSDVIAITGSGGFVGSLFSKYLCAEAQVIGLDMVAKDASTFRWSFASPVDDTAGILRRNGVTHLVHAAWDMRTNDLEDIRRTCVAGSCRLFEAAKAAGVENTVFISTVSAFEGARAAYGRSKLEVEKACLEAGGTVLRLGLVYGEGDGGVFGSIRKVVKSSRLVPMIGSGRAPQYILHVDTLAEILRRAVRGDFKTSGRPITVAQPEPIAFCDLLHYIAADEGKKITPLPVPWPLLYAGLKFAELVGLKLNFRSDSVLSFIFQNPAPDFGPMRQYEIEPKRLILPSNVQHMHG
jgi:nucleoside-diphosphate-sugar epimerase